LFFIYNVALDDQSMQTTCQQQEYIIGVDKSFNDKGLYQVAIRH